MPVAALLARLQASSLPVAFLTRLPDEARDALLTDAVVFSVPARRTFFSSTDQPRAGFIVEGLARTYLSSRDGRHLTVRYAREGDLIGNIAGPSAERAPLSVAAVTDCTIVEIAIGMLFELVQRDASVGVALLVEITARLQDSYAALAANTLGSMQERVAWHLLDLAIEAPDDGRLITAVTQQQLADSVGTVREVVARVLREFRDSQLVATTMGQIEVIDPLRLAAIAGRRVGPQP